jgi:hypothetical protein
MSRRTVGYAVGALLGFGLLVGAGAGLRNYLDRSDAERRLYEGGTVAETRKVDGKKQWQKQSRLRLEEDAKFVRAEYETSLNSKWPKKLGISLRPHRPKNKEEYPEWYDIFVENSDLQPRSILVDFEFPEDLGLSYKPNFITIPANTASALPSIHVPQPTKKLPHGSRSFVIKLKATYNGETIERYAPYSMRNDMDSMGITWAEGPSKWFSSDN